METVSVNWSELQLPYLTYHSYFTLPRFTYLLQLCYIPLAYLTTSTMTLPCFTLPSTITLPHYLCNYPTLLYLPSKMYPTSLYTTSTITLPHRPHLRYSTITPPPLPTALSYFTKEADAPSYVALDYFDFLKHYCVTDLVM